MTQLEEEKIVGAAPAGAESREAAAQAVREMFTSIAPRYDLLNHVLSDEHRSPLVVAYGAALRCNSGASGARVLDLCCGTGDMAFALRRRVKAADAQILGADFSDAMLQRAAAKTNGAAKNETAHAPSLRWIEADALHLPFPDAHFDLVTSAFRFRNLADYDAGLREIARVLRPALRMRHS